MQGLASGFLLPCLVDHTVTGRSSLQSFVVKVVLTPLALQWNPIRTSSSRTLGGSFGRAMVVRSTGRSATLADAPSRAVFLNVDEAYAGIEDTVVIFDTGRSPCSCGVWWQ